MFHFFKRLLQKPTAGLTAALRNSAVIVDVRTKEEFEQGHIAGSKNIPLSEIKLKTEMIRKWNKPVITVCRSGNRSVAAKNILATAGIDVYNGGAWNRLKTNEV